MKQIDKRRDRYERIEINNNIEEIKKKKKGKKKGRMHAKRLVCQKGLKIEN